MAVAVAVWRQACTIGGASQVPESRAASPAASPLDPTSPFSAAAAVACAPVCYGVQVVSCSQGQVPIQRLFGAEAQAVVSRLNIEGQHRYGGVWGCGGVGVWGAGVGARARVIDGGDGGRSVRALATVLVVQPFAAVLLCSS